MSKKALLAITEPRVTVPENKQNNILSWDVDNNYPARMHNIVANSVTAKNCLRVFSRFVMGQGLTDIDFSKQIINTDGQKADAFTRELVKSLGFLPAVAVHINYNGEFKKVEARVLDIKTVRLSLDKTKVAIHENWEKRPDKKTFKKTDIQYIDLYDPSPEAITTQVNDAGGWESYKGQVLFWSNVGLDYPAAEWDPAAEDMQTESNLKTFRSRSVKNNFVASQYIVVDDAAGYPEETHEEGEIVNPNKQDEEPDFASVIVNTVKQFQGEENAGAVMVIQKPSSDSTFELHTPDLQHFDGMYEKTESSGEKAILRGFMMPAPLVLEGGAAIFASGSIIEAAEAYYNKITGDDRLIIEELLTEVFTNWETELNKSGDYSIKPLQINTPISAEYFPYFTKNEIRESVGGAPVDEVEAEKKMLVETIGVGGTQSLVAVLVDGVLQKEQKTEILKTLFNFTDEQAKALVFGNTQKNDATNNA